MQSGLKLNDRCEFQEFRIFGESVDAEIAALANYALGLENEDIHFGSGVKLFFSHKNIGFVFNVIYGPQVTNLLNIFEKGNAF